MHQGKIIEFIEQGRFVSTLCLEDRGNRLHLLTSTNREVNVSPKRVLLVSSSAIDPVRPREELLERLRQTESIRETLKGQINVNELWELVRDEHERFNHRYLAQLCFGEPVSDDHLSALVRALFEDRLYFKLKDGQFLPNSEERVEQLITEREEAAAREEMLKAGGDWLKAVQEGKKASPPACAKEVIELLTNFVLYEREAPDYKFSKELLTRAGLTHTRKARALLVKLGIWDQDENLDLIRMQIKTSFGKEKLDLSSRVACTKQDFEGREDLRDLPLLTIDGPWTRDFDDAVSLEKDGDQLILGVHISDVAASIPQDSPLDREACLRASSLYLPRQQIPMIPPDLSQETLSLRHDCDRMAISLLAHLEKDGRLIDFRFTPSIVRVKRQLTYDESNQMLAGDPTLKKLYQLSMSLRSMRMEHDAISLSLPEIEVRFNDDGSVHLEMVEQNTPSRMLVAELMIFYNWLLARFCKQNEIPLLFRTQGEPSERLTEDQFGYIYYVFKQRRKLNPLKISTKPAPHSGLGLDVYTNATSPIRRYLDLVAQRQVISFLSEKPLPYDEENLEELRMIIEPTLKALERVRRNRIRYWTLKYLGQHIGKKYRAMVLDVLKSKYRILLLDFLHIAELRQNGEAGMYPGQQFNVVIKKSDPWDDILEVSYAGD
ncbi:MAG: RNB domain-containing ribonuclease [Deltaproteobacteria bacterium]|nr:RNB domain-containing ribonuclease [Deltaproteobacteria bacterium]